MAVSGPTVVRRQLGRRLRRLREASGRGEREIEEKLQISRTKLWRIESGTVPVKVPDVRALCWFYGADGEFTDALAALTVGTGGQGWWEEYSDVVPDWFRLYVGLEGAASRIRSYDGEIVPGALQTAEYARAVFHAARPDENEDAIRRHLAVRMERQETLFRRRPAPHIDVVLGAGVLAREVGGPEIMAAQLVRLCELNERDHVQVRVLPWSVGAHAAMVGAFQMLDFDDPEDPDVVYVETHTGGRVLEKPAEIQEYDRVFHLIGKQAVSIEEYQ